MSRPTPDDEYAAGIVSWASHAPFAKSKKSTQAFAERSMYVASITLSGASGAGPAEGDDCAATGDRQPARRTARARATQSNDAWRVVQSRRPVERRPRTAQGQRSGDPRL